VGLQPLVSAIIPTYNRASLVTEAIDSILEQTFRNIEIIVVDDGSTDDTQDRLAQYGDRIRVITQDNSGPASARNRGITAARGDLIAFLDSDDRWLPTKVARQVALLSRAGPSVPCCICNIRMQWSDGERGSFDIAALHPAIPEGLWANVDAILATRCLLFNQGVMVRREVLQRVGGFDESLWLLEDHELALRLSLEGPWAYIHEPLVIWRETRNGSLYQSARGQAVCFNEALVRILERHLAAVMDRDEYKHLRRFVSRELRSARRDLKAAKMAQLTSWRASVLAIVLRRIGQYKRALFVRSPWFPKMHVESCDC
jgi:glycosyltransferase involved in cell wall biosynthesis